MRIALLSDVHGNLPAFEAVLDDIESEGAEEIWCLGDLVGYGAQPDECVALARERCKLSLAGNHDLVVTGEIPISDFSLERRRRGALDAGDDLRGDDGVPQGLAPADPTREPALFHASPRDPVWEYVLSSWQADECMDLMEARVAAIGHSHVALWFHRDGRRRGDRRQAASRTERDVSSGKWLVNPGGVGQPRDGDPRAAWLLLDTGTGQPPGAGSSIRSTWLPGRSRTPACPGSSRSGSTADSDHSEAHIPPARLGACLAAAGCGSETRRASRSRRTRPPRSRTSSTGSRPGSTTAAPGACKDILEGPAARTAPRSAAHRRAAGRRGPGRARGARRRASTTSGARSRASARSLERGRARADRDDRAGDRRPPRRRPSRPKRSPPTETEPTTPEETPLPPDGDGENGGAIPDRNGNGAEWARGPPRRRRRRASEPAHRDRGPLRDRAPPRGRRHVHGLPGERHRARAARGGQAARRAPRRRRGLRRTASGARRSRPRGSSTPTSCRSSTPARTPPASATTSSWSTWTGPRRGHAARAQAARHRRDRQARARRLPRARLRPPRRRDPPRREARQPARSPRRWAPRSSRTSGSPRRPSRRASRRSAPCSARRPTCRRSRPAARRRGRRRTSTRWACAPTSS